MGTFEDIVVKGAVAVKDSWLANYGWYILVFIAVITSLAAIYNQYINCKKSCKFLYCIFTLDGLLNPCCCCCRSDPPAAGGNVKRRSPKYSGLNDDDFDAYI